jgi:hypothetical protein
MMKSLRGIPVRSVFRSTAAVTALGLTLLLYPGCTHKSEQDKVKEVIFAVREAANKKDVKGILENLSKTYRDPQGYTYDTVKGLVLGYFLRHGKIHVYIPGIEAEIDGNDARASVQAVLSGGDAGSSALFPDSLGMYRFTVSLKKEPKDWKITSAEWKRISEGENYPPAER